MWFYLFFFPLLFCFKPGWPPIHSPVPWESITPHQVICSFIIVMCSQIFFSPSSTKRAAVLSVYQEYLFELV